MLETKYDFKKVENNKYDFWLKNHLFEDRAKDKTPFTIVMPPPNITGNLHLGHALNGSIQDVIIRYKKMSGYDALWLPGMDHAAIATEAKVVYRLKTKGINKHSLGREGFLEECWKWTEEHKASIHSQWAKLGLSVDYTKERFTLDEDLNKAVREVFIRLFNEGLIYRGERIINWDPEAKTALSNEEVIYKDVDSAFYHLKYFIEGTKDYLEVVTTRPETLFGDTAVAVNPKDKRYTHLIGKKVILPIVNKLIPIIEDNYADIDFGTGVVKITPAHDPNDFEVGQRHNLERIVCINEDGTMNEFALNYQSMDRLICRSEIVKELEEKNILIKIQKMTHSVGHSERTGAVVEPYLSKQWFVKMGDIATDLLDAQKNEDTRINFYPPNFEKILNHWMENCKDWCISRQLWWGHRIPAWYKEDEIKVQINSPGEGWIQDEDVLDTWFSSALWPFSTLGWPEETEDLKRYFPTDVLVTAYDIIFFWVARMAFSSLKLMNERPFKDCVIHGLIRDKDGRKMSKSLGNGIDPMDLIDQYGTDALRFYLTTSSSMGNDIKFDTQKVAGAWNFINKLWNASRYVLINTKNFETTKIDVEKLEVSDKWILTKLNQTIKDVTKNMEKYEFNNAGNTLYSFIWNDFCDSYIELSKKNMNQNTKNVLLEVLNSILKLLHPFMPFVTEEIFLILNPNKKSIMISNYPIYNKEEVYTSLAKEMDIIIKEITNIRNFKVNNSIPKNSQVKINTKKEFFNIVKAQIRCEILEEEKASLKTKEYISPTVSVVFYFEEQNLQKEDINIIKLNITNLENSILKRKELLNNKNYISKAPSNIVLQEQQNLKEEKEKLVIEKNKLSI